MTVTDENGLIASKKYSFYDIDEVDKQMIGKGKKFFLIAKRLRFMSHFFFGKYLMQSTQSKVIKYIEDYFLYITENIVDYKFRDIISVTDSENEIFLFKEIIFSILKIGVDNLERIKSGQIRLLDVMYDTLGSKIIESARSVYTDFEMQRCGNLASIMSNVYHSIDKSIFLKDIDVNKLVMRRDEFEYFRVPRTDIIQYAKLDDPPLPGLLFFPEKIVYINKSISKEKVKADSMLSEFNNQKNDLQLDLINILSKLYENLLIDIPSKFCDDSEIRNIVDQLMILFSQIRSSYSQFQLSEFEKCNSDKIFNMYSMMSKNIKDLLPKEYFDQKNTIKNSEKIETKKNEYQEIVSKNLEVEHRLYIENPNLTNICTKGFFSKFIYSDCNIVISMSLSFYDECIEDLKNNYQDHLVLKELILDLFIDRRLIITEEDVSSFDARINIWFEDDFDYLRNMMSINKINRYYFFDNFYKMRDLNDFLKMKGSRDTIENKLKTLEKVMNISNLNLSNQMKFRSDRKLIGLPVSIIEDYNELSIDLEDIEFLKFDDVQTLIPDFEFTNIIEDLSFIIDDKINKDCFLEDSVKYHRLPSLIDGSFQDDGEDNKLKIKKKLTEIKSKISSLKSIQYLRRSDVNKEKLMLEEVSEMNKDAIESCINRWSIKKLYLTDLLLKEVDKSEDIKEEIIQIETLIRRYEKLLDVLRNMKFSVLKI
jgi:hypothetical protein